MESVALHDHRDLVTPCAEVMNEEWPRSLSARIHSLEKSNDQLPYNIVLIETSQSQARVLGHSRITSVIGIPNACFVESVVVKKSCRGQGLGRRIMADTEEIAAKLGFEVMYLTTHDQQGFYSRLGYEYCVPVVTAGGATGLLSKIKNKKFLESLERLGNCAAKMDQLSSSGLSQPSSVSAPHSSFVSHSNPTKPNVRPPPPVPHIHGQPPMPPPLSLPHINDQPPVPPPPLLPHSHASSPVPPRPPLPHINGQSPVPPPPPVPHLHAPPPVPHLHAPPPVPPPAPPVPRSNLSQSLEPPLAPVPHSLPPPPSHEKVVRMDPSQISWMKKNLAV